MDVVTITASLIGVLGARLLWTKRIHPYPSEDYHPVTSVPGKIDRSNTKNLINTHIPSTDQNAKKFNNPEIAKNSKYQKQYAYLVNQTVNLNPDRLLDPTDVYKRQTPKSHDVVNVL